MYLYFEFKWNREVDFEKDYISPGSFTIVLRNGDIRHFDFQMNEQGHIDDDKTKTYVQCRDLDITYDDGEKLHLCEFADIEHIEEIFIGVSDNRPAVDEAEKLNVTEILNITAGDTWYSPTLGHDIIQKVTVSPDLYDVMRSVYIDHNI